MTKNVGQQFDLFSGRAAKEEGMSVALTNKQSLVQMARRIAKDIAREDPGQLCNIDLVQAKLIPMGIHLGMAAGSLFKEDCWKFHSYKQSHRVTNHARPITVWRLVR